MIDVSLFDFFYINEVQREQSNWLYAAGENQRRGDIEGYHFQLSLSPSSTRSAELSISVKPTQMLALVGPSGCGKSTVVSLIGRFYDPLIGLLLINGTNSGDCIICWLCSQIGIVSLKPVLFDGSIAENIYYGALFREVSDEKVIETAKAAKIHNFLQTLSGKSCCIPS